jgi:hypothetical protein
MARRGFLFQPFSPAARHGRAPGPGTGTARGGAGGRQERLAVPGPDNLSVQANLGGQKQRQARRGQPGGGDPALERQADALAEQARRGASLHPRDGTQIQRPSLTPPDGGRPLGPETRELAERRLGLDPSAIRVHDGVDAQRAASAIGARAFADGGHIWLGPGEREGDRDLMAHELAHLTQGVPGVHPRSATWLERRAWLSFFDHYLPRRFLNNYMDDTGASITLDLMDMMAVNPIVNIRRSPDFATELGALQAQVKASNAAGTPAPAAKYIEISGPGQAMTNGTLGNFTIHYKWALMVQPDGSWLFSGIMDFYDIWDFDPKPFGTSGRSTAGEIKTRVAAYGLPGSPFKIFSVPAPCVQSGSDARAVWAGGTPTHVGDQAGRAGADVEVGGAGGEALGPEGAAGGAEAGAQSAEDLNP